MRYHNLGRTGLQVSQVCLGSMTFGKQPNFGVDEQVSREIIAAALDLGVNFIDSADMYGGGETERILGRAITGRRPDLVLTTKFRLRTEEGPNGDGASRHRIMRQVERSLTSLGTDYIDVYFIHKPDPATPIDETLRALDDLVRAGKVRYIGCSNFEAWRIMESLWVSDKMNLERFVVDQPRYSILDRHIEAEVLPVCRRYGLGVMCASPLAEGWLSGAYNSLESAKADSRGWMWDFDNAANRLRFDRVQRLIPIAERHGVTMAQLSLAWLLHRGDDVIPLLGAISAEQLLDNAKCLDVRLEPEDLAEIDDISPSPYVDMSVATTGAKR